jgi:phospholipid/cholesterol/gamma-HCH transport system permease protein
MPAVAAEEVQPEQPALAPVTGFLDRIKNVVFLIQDISIFAARTILGCFRRPFYGRDLYEQMHYSGNGSLHLAVLSSFFAGQALALQLSKELTQMGSKDYLGRLVATAVVRSLGPVLTGMVVASRMSAGHAAEVGSMRISNQIEALIAYGIDPIRKLAVPRLLALVITLPALTTLADAISILGGYLISRVVVHIAPTTYWSGVWASMEWGDLLVGAVKPFFFAAIIAIVGTYKGFHAEGGTKGVGIATTEAVVICSVGILIADLVLTRVVFNLLGW